LAPFQVDQIKGILDDANSKIKSIINEAAITDGGRRRKARRTNGTVRMKKADYLREHHHLFKILRNPTRRALNAELRSQKRELKERGLKG
jgi:hypothetical protein